MTDSINPYAVASSGLQPSHPIHFGGTLTADDLMMALRDSPPKRGFARLQYPVLVVGVVAGIVGMQLVFATSGQEVSSIIWMLLAFLFLPPWLALVRFLSPSQRKRIRRLAIMAANQTRISGWLDDDVLVMADQNSVLRARWAFFASPLVFPTHLMLPLTTDPSHRVVLPIRFFSSAADVRQVCQWFGEKIGFLVHQPPDDKTLAAEVASVEADGAEAGGADAATRLDVDQARAWSDSHWPFGSDDDRQFDWTLDWTAGTTSRRFAMKSSLAILLVMIWYFLPIWIAVVGWLVTEYWFYGNWSFLGQRVFSSVLVLGPSGFIFCFFLQSAIQAAMRIRRSQSQPLAVRLRPSGIHLSHATFASWFAWTSVADVITEPDGAGWVAKESMDEIRFPRVCFDSEESFERLKAVLESRAQHEVSAPG